MSIFILKPRKISNNPQIPYTISTLILSLSQSLGFPMDVPLTPCRTMFRATVCHLLPRKNTFMLRSVKYSYLHMQHLHSPHFLNIHSLSTSPRVLCLKTSQVSSVYVKDLVPITFLYLSRGPLTFWRHLNKRDSSCL